QAHDSVLATPAHPSTSPRICFAHLAESSGPAHEDHPGHNERDADDLHRAVEPVPPGRPIDPFLEAVRAEGTWTITSNNVQMQRCEDHCQDADGCHCRTDHPSQHAAPHS